jgi:hypothetical protein
MNESMKDLQAFQAGVSSLRMTADSLDSLGFRLENAEMPSAADAAFRCAAQIREAKKLIEGGYDGLLGSSVAHSQAMVGNLLVGIIEGCIKPKNAV